MIQQLACNSLNVKLYYSAHKIHISDSTMRILEDFNMFDLELRGDLEIKVFSIVFFNIQNIFIFITFPHFVMIWRSR